MEFWKDLIILKESKKPRDKFLRVWAKNQLRFEMFEKILKFTYQNLNGKVIFIHFLSNLPGLLSFYTPLQPSKIWGSRGSLAPGLGVVLSSLGGGVGGLHKTLKVFDTVWQNSKNLKISGFFKRIFLRILWKIFFLMKVALVYHLTLNYF